MPSHATRVADWPNTTRVLPWALVGFVAMLWLIPFDSIYLPLGLPVDATLDRPLLVLLFGLWLLGERANSGRGPSKVSPVHWALVIFGMIAVLSIILNAGTLVRLGDFEVSLKKLVLLASYGTFFALATSIVRPSEVRNLTKFLVAVASITAIFVLVEFRLGTNIFHDWIGPLFPGYVRPEGIGALDAIGRKGVVGPGVLPLAVAAMLAMALPFAVMGMATLRERRRMLYAIATALLLASALATSKKTGLVGPAVCLLVLIAYSPRAMLRLAPFGVALLVMVHLFAPGAIGTVVNQFSPNSFGKVDTTQDRASDYEAIKPDLAHHPVLGRGYESYDQKKHRILDNQYLTLAIGVGLVGVLAYLAVFGSAFLVAHRDARSGDPDRAPPAMAAAAAIAAAVSINALIDFLSLPQLPYLFCFVAALVVVSARGHPARPAGDRSVRER
jgi:hypothetical protein